MKPFEYLLVFAAVILGLAVTDLAYSLHRLIGAGERVRWGFLSPLAAILSLIAIVVQWWSWYRAENLINGLTFGMYLLVVITAILQFLMAACALPDESSEAVIDLDAHYQKISARFWILFTAHWVMLQVVTAWAQIAIQHAQFGQVSPLWLIAPIGASLAVIKNRIWQFAGLIGFIGLYLVAYATQTLAQTIGEALTR